MTPSPFPKTLNQSDVTRGVISLATHNNSKILLPMEGVLSEHILISDHLLITPINRPHPTLPQPYPLPSIYDYACAKYIRSCECAKK